MKFFLCGGCPVVYCLHSNNGSALTLFPSNIRLVGMSRISDKAAPLEKTNSSCMTLHFDEDGDSRDSGISVASALSTSLTNFDNTPVASVCSTRNEEFCLSGCGSLNSQESPIYENVPKKSHLITDDNNVEFMQLECDDGPSERQVKAFPNLYNQETPKMRSRKLRWRRLFQNTVNFELDNNRANNCFRRGQRKIRSFVKEFQNKENGNENAITITAIKQFFEDTTATTHDLQNISLWPRTALPESLRVDYSLTTVNKPQVQSGAFKSISSQEMARVMESMSNEEFIKKFIIVDCRYPYEYNGGHLKGAVNVWDWKSLKTTFYPDCPAEFKAVSSRIPIFYCEFSQKRGPQLAEALRKYDRKRNEWRYPEVDYKEIYLLDSGYKKFFEDGYTHLCEPPSYTTMLATPHREDLKRFNMHRSRSAIELNAAINRTFEDALINEVRMRHSSWLIQSPTRFLKNANLVWLSNEVTLKSGLANTLRFSESPEPEQ